MAPLSPLDLNVQVPHHFRCPISLELMRDPVTLSTGQTYDRSSIERWVAGGNDTCPVTRQKLDDFSLTPNHTLRRLIQNWCVANRSKGIDRIPTPTHPADPHTIKALLARASALDPMALRALRSLAIECEKNKSLMLDLGVVPALISALFNDGQDMAVVEEALSALVLFPLTDAHRLSVMQPQRLDLVASILQWGKMEARVNAAMLVEMVSDSKELVELRAMLATKGGIMEGVTGLLKREAGAIKVGIKALFSLCLCKAGKERAVELGACAMLIEVLVDVEKKDAERALGTIEQLCSTERGCVEVGKHALAAAVLVKFILKLSERATEYAVGCLLAICSSSMKIQEEALQAGVMKELLLLIQSDCSSRSKSKAMSLLKLLRGAWLLDSCMSHYGRTDVAPF